MALSRTKKRWLIITGSIILVLVILIIFANNILSRKADTILREKLSEIDTTSYLIDYDKVRVNIFSRSVKVFNVTVTPTKAALENVKRSRLAKPVFEVKLHRLNISSVSIMKAIKGNGVDVGEITLDEPDITVYGPGELFNGKHEGSSGKSIFSSDTIMETLVKEASLNYFEIENAHIRYINLGDDKTVLETKGLDLSVDDLWLHHPDGDTLSHVLEVDDIQISLKSHSMELPGNFYSLLTGPLEIKYKDREISLDSLKLIPAYPIGKFSKAFGKQTDRFDVSATNIFISGIVFDSLMNKKLIAEQIKLSSPRADICRDKRVARDMSIFPKLFQTAVAQLPIKVYIKSVTASEAYVKYQEIVEGSEIPGSVVLDQLNLNIEGVCNYADSIKKGQAILVDAKAQLMSKSPIQVNLYLPIGNHVEYFTFHGNAGPFPATNLNPLIQHLAFVEATGGTVNGLKFYGMAMNDTTAGRLEFKYTDLGVGILKKKKEAEGITKENKFFSFVAKTAMHKNNPHKDKDIRIAKMTFVRDRNKGFFNYIWKTIQNGLIVTLTPGKKRLAHDMSWSDFQSKWRKTLLVDWDELQVTSEKKKNRR